MVPWLTQAFPLWSRLTATILPRVLAERESCFLQKLWPTFPCILLVFTALQTYFRTNCFGQGDGYADWFKVIGPTPELVGSILLKTWLRARRNISLRAKSGNYWWVKGETTNKWAFISRPVHLNINHPSHDVIHLSCVLGIIYLVSKEGESHVMSDGLYVFCTPLTLSTLLIHSCSPVNTCWIEICWDEWIIGNSREYP